MGQIRIYFCPGNCVPPVSEDDVSSSIYARDSYCLATSANLGDLAVIVLVRVCRHSSKVASWPMMAGISLWRRIGTPGYWSPCSSVTGSTNPALEKASSRTAMTARISFFADSGILHSLVLAQSIA